VFGQLTALEHLDLRKQHMAANGLAALAAHLSRLSHLTCLELDNNNLGFAGASELALAVSTGSLPSLEVCILLALGYVVLFSFFIRCLSLPEKRTSAPPHQAQLLHTVIKTVILDLAVYLLQQLYSWSSSASPGRIIVQQLRQHKGPNRNASQKLR
jgi:hypothetical protein